MVSKLGTERCANKDAESQTEVGCETLHRLERGTSASEDAELRKGVNYEIPHRFERGTSVNEDPEP